jgi:aspartyl-tRNA(Asn)/glutamyl-tRNA(Gln) amidotransferase subunit B
MTNTHHDKRRPRPKDSFVDFNRAGRALIEIVFSPDLRSSSDASIAVETLRSLLKHIGTCDGKMEEGSLRCDLNVSIAPIVVEQLSPSPPSSSSSSSSSQQAAAVVVDSESIVQYTGNRVEVKNLNSLRQIQLAAEYESLRQAIAMEDGSPTAQETRTLDVKTGKTVLLRTKEGAKDYRFMPEPDLPPLVLNDQVFGTPGMDLQSFLTKNLPELPEDAQQRLQKEYGLSAYTATVLTGDPPAIQLLDNAIQEAKQQLLLVPPLSDTNNQKIHETIANLLCNELFALVREFELQRLIKDGTLDSGTGEQPHIHHNHHPSVRFSKITANQLGEVGALVLEGTISNTMAKHLLRILYQNSQNSTNEGGVVHSARQVAHERGLKLITDSQMLAEICRNVIVNNPEEMERYKLGGKFAKKITKFLLGKAMADSRGNAHPERLNEVLVDVLEEVAPLAQHADGGGNIPKQ